MPHEYTAGRQPSALAAGVQEKVAKLGVSREPSGPEQGHQKAWRRTSPPLAQKLQSFLQLTDNYGGKIIFKAYQYVLSFRKNDRLAFIHKFFWGRKGVTDTVSLCHLVLHWTWYNAGDKQTLGKEAREFTDDLCLSTDTMCGHHWFYTSHCWWL